MKKKRLPQANSILVWLTCGVLLSLHSAASWPQAAGQATERLDARAKEAVGTKGAAWGYDGVFNELLYVFDVPISFEGLPESGRSTDIATQPQIAFPITKGERLGPCLDRFMEATKGALRWDVIHDQIVIFPARQAGDPPIDNLDVIVSLEVHDASVWEACCALGRAINQNSKSDYKLTFFPSGPDEVRNPYPAIVDDRVVTVSVSDVTAREALCAILSQAPVPLSYRYICGLDLDSVDLDYRKDGKIMYGDAMDKNEVKYWSQKNAEKLQGVERKDNN